MKRACEKSLLLGVAVALAIATGAARAAESEAVAFGINNFGLDANECGSTDPDPPYEVTPDLSYCDDNNDAFVDAFRDEGWSQVEHWFNTAVDGRDWMDAAKTPAGQDTLDPYGADFADVAMLCTHGGHNHAASPHYSFFEMGDDAETCQPNTSTGIELGNDGDLEIFITMACQSAQYDVWTDDGYFSARSRDGSLNTWLGHHGDGHDSKTNRNHYEDYLRESFDNGLGDNWLDEMYRNPLFGDQECPVAITFCEAGADCDRQYEYGGFEDRFKVDTSDAKSWSTYYYFTGCDPEDGAPLPN